MATTSMTAQLRRAQEALDAAKQRRIDVIAEAHRAGLSYRDIGEAIGTTRQAARYILERAGLETAGPPHQE